MKLLPFLILTALPLCSWSSTAVGESNGYLMSEWKTSVFEPLGWNALDVAYAIPLEQSFVFVFGVQVYGGN